MAPGYSTASIAFVAGPTVVATFLNHFASWPARHGKRSRHAKSSSISPTSLDTLPGNQLRYEEGLRVLRRFLEFASTHPVEDVQGYTAQPLPIPRWVRRDVVTIPEGIIDRAAGILIEHLKSYGTPEVGGMKLVGGENWWQVRGRELEGEWVEMAKDYRKRQTSRSNTVDSNDKSSSWRNLRSIHRSSRKNLVLDGSGGEVDGDRVILYIHGGAFFFSSLDMHRYQIQRHVRKAGGRAFVPNYRLSPQYPFPCGLLDSLAAYLYLINPPEGIQAIEPHNIILMGDSAGGGMSLSLLVLIREMGLPMPAAASLMSPWVDLTHSMPSIMEWDGGDYIPSVGFHYKPSPVWPPPPSTEDAIEVEMDGKKRVLTEQIQLYCPNNLLTHPLVSSINQGSLGGLCPLYISAGSAELLRDEVIYVAHKASNPTQYPPSPVTLAEYPEQAALVDKYPPTRVHLQVFEGACHVATTLAWTRTAKQIFRGTANFNIWAFKAAAKGAEMKHTSASVGRKARPVLDALVMKPLKGRGNHTPISPSPLSPLSPTTPGGSATPSRVASSADVLSVAIDSTAASMVNESPATTSEADYSSSSAVSSGEEHDARNSSHQDYIKVRGVEPQFRGRTIVAERVSVHGRISPMEPDSQVPALQPELRNQTGRVRGNGPIVVWLKHRAEWDSRWPDAVKEWREVRVADRKRAEQVGFLTHDLQGERPPLSAMVSIADRELARRVATAVDEPTTKTTGAVVFWAKMASKADADADAYADAKSKHHHHHHQHHHHGHHLGHTSRRKSWDLGLSRWRSSEKSDEDRAAATTGGSASASTSGTNTTKSHSRRDSFRGWDLRRLSLRRSSEGKARSPLSPTFPATAVSKGQPQLAAIPMQVSKSMPEKSSPDVEKAGLGRATSTPRPVEVPARAAAEKITRAATIATTPVATAAEVAAAPTQPAPPARAAAPAPTTTTEVAATATVPAEAEPAVPTVVEPVGSLDEAVTVAPTITDAEPAMPATTAAAAPLAAAETTTTTTTTETPAPTETQP